MQDKLKLIKVKSITERGLKISYLAQDPKLNSSLTIEECILQSDNEILSIIARYEAAMLKPENEEEYQAAFDAMEQHQAWDLKRNTNKFYSNSKLEQLHAKVSHLSGGQRKRVALCIALLENPDLLILDEPTNHLDLEMIEWLEGFFEKKKRTLLMVTHDRYFLERVCNEIIELDNGQLYTYKGNYSDYLEKRNARIVQDDVEAHKPSRHLKELEWMRRQPKARTTKSNRALMILNKLKPKHIKEDKNTHFNWKSIWSVLAQKSLNSMHWEKVLVTT